MRTAKITEKKKKREEETTTRVASTGCGVEM
jgi:hypothetical protein